MFNSFPASQIFCVFDYETYSEADLRKVGAYEYSVHPSTEIICAAWRIGTFDELKNGRAPRTAVWSDLDGGEMCSFLSSLAPFYAALTNPDVLLVAHNALFEQVITRNVFATKVMYSKRAELQSIPSSRFICTAALASALALPRNLEGAAAVLKLPVQKYMGGRRLMLKWSKPRKPSKNNPATRHTDPDELVELLEYCVTDVDTEVALFTVVPPLTPLERRVWELDQAINLRGITIDRELVETVLRLVDEETTEIDRRTSELTFGAVETTKKVAAVRAWLAQNDYHLDDLRASTVEESLRSLAGREDRADVREMLELRQARAMTSTAKYEAFEARSRFDGRVRDTVIYHRASTGRWGGAGVQPQNFPRGSVKDTIQAVDVVKGGDLELVRLIYGDVMKTLSSCLRGVIVAPEGHTLDVADYAAIEARVLFWVAEHAEGIRAFRDGRPIYEEMAAVIFGVPVEKIPKSGFQRFLGKSAVLGCGYAMGPPKFQATCASQGQEVDDDMAKRAVMAYRRAHAPVVTLWKTLERLACNAVQMPGRSFAGNKTFWRVEGDFLFCTLPSGRRLAYYGPSVQFEPPPYGGEPRPVLYHYGEDAVTHKWVRSKTYGGRLTENVVQAIARDLLAEALLRIEATGRWRTVLHVHDEIVAERRLGGVGSIGEFCDLMAALPNWAAGCPVKAEGWTGARYRK